MTIFQLIAALLTFAGVSSYLNHRFIGLPATIGHMAFALAASVGVLLAGQLGLFDPTPVRNIVSQIDFSRLVLDGLLAFLLFAGALHIDLDELKAQRWPVAILATLGVVLATAILGTLVWFGAQFFAIPLPYVWALLFGALISPTDPIAVLGILKQVGVSKRLFLQIGGESLFNDGIGIVLFLTLLGLATQTADIHATNALVLLLQEVGGGLGLGAALGWGVYRLLLPIDDYKVEVLLTLALVTGGYSLAELLNVSAPLCMVAAGLVIGNHGRVHGMSEKTRHHLDVFWELIDDILNAVLFILAGLKILIVPFSTPVFLLGLFAVGAALVARFASVALPVLTMRHWFNFNFDRGTVRLLTWGGLRGGLSLALALSLPESPYKPTLLGLTFAIVIFSILVQGLTFKPLIGRILGNP